MQRMCTGEVTTDKIRRGKRRGKPHWLWWGLFQLTPLYEKKVVRELHEDFKKQTYNRQTTYHQGSLCMSISEHKHGLSSTIDFKCNRKIFQEFPYVHTHKIPGGQYTNLLLQSKQLGLTDNFPEVKRKYTTAIRSKY